MVRTGSRERPLSPLRIGSWVAASLFVFSAAVQWNDPDPLRWILAYAVASAIAAAHGLGLTIRTIAGIAAIGYAVLAVAVAPADLSASLPDLIAPAMKTLSIEQARESLGLGLCALWCGVLYFAGRRSDDGRS